MRKLVLHLGLPKTATTTLQDSFFPQIKGYVGKVSADKPDLGLPPKHSDLCKNFGYYDVFAEHRANATQSLINQIPFDFASTILLSNEAISRWPLSRPLGPWSPVEPPLPGEGSRRGTHPMIPFLAELNQALPQDVDLLTVITLRAQATYLPSQAAEKGVGSMGPIVRRITKRRDEFILWDPLINDLERLRGPEKHLTLLFEDGVESNARQIVEFGSLEAKTGQFDFAAISTENKRRHGATWERAAGARREDRFAKIAARLYRLVFRRNGPALSNAYLRVRAALVRGRDMFSKLYAKPLALSDRQRSKLENYVRASNKSLSQRLGRELGPLGY